MATFDGLCKTEWEVRLLAARAKKEEEALKLLMLDRAARAGELADRASTLSEVARWATGLKNDLTGLVRAMAVSLEGKGAEEIEQILRVELESVIGAALADVTDA